MLPGTTAERLLHGAPCAVAVAPRGYERDDIRHIGVAYEGSPEAEAALRAAEALALELGAALTVYCVVEPPPATDSMIAAGTGAEWPSVTAKQHGRQLLYYVADHAPQGLQPETAPPAWPRRGADRPPDRRRGRSPLRRLPRIRAAAARAARQRVRRSSCATPAALSSSRPARRSSRIAASPIPPKRPTPSAMIFSPAPARPQPDSALIVCATCGSDFVSPIEWADHDETNWWMRLRCGQCGEFREVDRLPGGRGPLRPRARPDQRARSSRRWRASTVSG